MSKRPLPTVWRTPTVTFWLFLEPQPPWRAGNEREREAMFWWCEVKLGVATQRLVQDYLIVPLQGDETLVPPPYKRPVHPNLADAARDVTKIRRLWVEYYGRKNRHLADGLSALEIAARRWGVKPAEIEEYLKHHKP